MYIDTMINVLIICVILSFCLAVLPILVYQYQLGMMASQISRTVSVNGMCSSEQINDVKNAFGTFGNHVNVEVIKNDEAGNIEVLDADMDSKIQLSEKFTVRLVYDYNVSLGGMANSEVTLSANSTGRSEVYWKNADLE